MIQVLKASAGSGKTYALAREYLRLILKDERPDGFRHVLAVTFTNKATEEMKRRILKELYTLSTEPETSHYREDFVPSLAPDLPSLQQKAKRRLSAILNDYTDFAISTIDRFFQQTLRAFSHEIGQFSTYQVQLDRKELVAEGVDRLLDSLAEGKDSRLLEWLTESVQEELLSKGRFSLEKGLQEVADSLWGLPEGRVESSRSELKALKKQCKEIMEAFAEKVSTAAEACLQALQTSTVDPAESNSGWMKALYAYNKKDALKHPVAMPTAAFQKKAGDQDKWFAKTKSQLLQQLGGALDAPLEAFLDCFGPSYDEYLTACAIQGQLYSLGVATQLRESLTQLQKDKNILSIDDSNTLLKQIIDGTETPFIYERLGVRFEDFLLDEFQDTSDVQWDNLKPLLHESENAGNESLVVGDVKQSIYRWRGSDWDLLGRKLELEFREVNAQVLDCNWRTCREIVQFNNGFFAWAADALDKLLGSEGRIKALYADVQQQVRFGEGGSVQVRFVQEQLPAIFETLEQLRSRGARWGDIAILVRGNIEGSCIASALVQEKIPVVSDDSLFVKASVTVRRLVSQLSLLDSPARQDDETSLAAYLARQLSTDLPAHYYSLVDLAEGLLRNLRDEDPALFEAETPYIQAFMDYLQDWTVAGGNQLSAFLRQWEGAQPKISSPETGDSVRVMTIHKSKGLEFPHVIVPFAHKLDLYKAPVQWCSPAAEKGGALEAQQGKLFRVSLDGGKERTYFSKDLQRERELQAIDTLNVMYVAFTRAIYGLTVLASPPPQAILKGGTDWKNLSQLLYTYVGDSFYEVGKPFDFSQIKRETSPIPVLETAYPSFPEQEGNRLKFSPEAADYFGPDGSYGLEASPRIRGNVLHGILSRTGVAGDLQQAVAEAVQLGELPQADAPGALAFLQERLAAVQDREWFSPAVQSLREQAILTPGGEEYRPDRVVVFPDGHLEIIDFKFGKPESSYLRQVHRYMELYRAMGYSAVQGFLWYLFTGEIQNVS